MACLHILCLNLSIRMDIIANHFRLYRLLISHHKKRVTGIGGLFFKSKDPKASKDWYKKHLDFNTDDYGCTFWWKDKNDNDASTQWSPFKGDTTYFEPSKKDFMFNYRVEDLETLIKTLREEGVTIVGDMQTYDYGKFAWILDNENNKIELWEPIDAVFK